MGRSRRGRALRDGELQGDVDKGEISPWRAVGKRHSGENPREKSRGGRGGRDSHRESPRRVDIPPETAAGRRGGRRDHQRQSYREGGWTCRNKEGHRAKRENPERVREKRTEGTRRLSGERAPWRRKGRKPEAGSDGHRETLNLTGKGEDRSAKTGKGRARGTKPFPAHRVGA